MCVGYYVYCIISSCVNAKAIVCKDICINGFSALCWIDILMVASSPLLIACRSVFDLTLMCIVVCVTGIDFFHSQGRVTFDLG